jgi:hypothetical protein
VRQVVGRRVSLQDRHDVDARALGEQRVVPFDRKPLMLGDRQARPRQLRRLAHEVLRHGCEQVAAAAPPSNLVGVDADRLGIPAVLRNGRKRAAVQNPVAGRERGLAPLRSG